jgi:hypothetical protein
VGVAGGRALPLSPSPPGSGGAGPVARVRWRGFSGPGSVARVRWPGFGGAGDPVLTEPANQYAATSTSVELKSLPLNNKGLRSAIAVP